MSDYALPSIGSLPTTIASRLQHACRRFEESWKGAERPRIEDYLASAADAERSLYFRALLARELAFRARAGEKAATEEYRERFPVYADLISAVFSAAESVVDKVDTGPRVEAATEASPPERLGRYRITATLGAGGFGIVYKGRDDELLRDVAIKVPHRKRVVTPEDAEGYLAEARSVAHPGLTCGRRGK